MEGGGGGRQSVKREARTGGGGVEGKVYGCGVMPVVFPNMWGGGPKGPEGEEGCEL